MTTKSKKTDRFDKLTDQPLTPNADVTTLNADGATPNTEPKTPNADGSTGSPPDTDTLRQAQGAENAPPNPEPQTPNPEGQTPPEMEPYFAAYPGNKVFYRTADRQIFLEKDYHLAVNHQQRLKKGQLETFKRE